MNNTNRKIFNDVYRFYESIEEPESSQEFWCIAAVRMETVLADNGNDELCRDLLVACYNAAARKVIS